MQRPLREKIRHYVLIIPAFFVTSVSLDYLHPLVFPNDILYKFRSYFDEIVIAEIGNSNSVNVNTNKKNTTEDHVDQTSCMGQLCRKWGAFFTSNPGRPISTDNPRMVC